MGGATKSYSKGGVASQRQADSLGGLTCLIHPKTPRQLLFLRFKMKQALRAYATSLIQTGPHIGEDFNKH